MPNFRGTAFHRSDSASFPQGDLNEVAYGHGHRERDILWSSVHLLQRGSPLAEGHQGSCKRFIAKGIYSSSIAASTGPFLQVAPIESAAARTFVPFSEAFPAAALPIGR